MRLRLQRLRTTSEDAAQPRKRRGRRLPRVALLLALVLLIPVTGLAALILALNEAPSPWAFGSAQFVLACVAGILADHASRADARRAA